MVEDYYKILGVDKKASPAEIKSGYRKKAKEFHPDRNKGDKNAEEKFKKISEAYAVLSDPEKRKNYDMFGSEKFHQRFSQEDIFRGSNMEDILREFGFGDIFGGFGGGRRSYRQSGFGSDPFGGGPFGGHSAPNLDVTSKLDVTLEESVKGCSRLINLNTGNAPEELTVKIPPGIREGGKLRLSGKGNAYGGSRGDLYIEVRILPHKRFQRDGDDLITKVEIDISTALLGGPIDVLTIDGTKSVKVPAGTGSGQKIRVKGEGVKKLKGGNNGDLYIEVRIKIPKSLTDEQKRLVENLRKTGL